MLTINVIISIRLHVEVFINFLMGVKRVRRRLGYIRSRVPGPLAGLSNGKKVIANENDYAPVALAA